MSDMRAISGKAKRLTRHQRCWKWTFILPSGSGDQSSATLSRAAPRNHEWCGNNCPAWAWPRRWAGSSGPSRHYSAPPRRFSQTPPCLRSAALLPGSATKKEKGQTDQGICQLHRDPSSNPPWCAQASEWTPDWRASGNPQCWDRPRPLTCGVTLSSRGCCECPRKTTQRSDTHLHFRTHPLSSEYNSQPTRQD